jgi:hypothetical protein
MREIAGCCEDDYRVGPLPKAEVKPDVVISVTSQQHEANQEKQNGN